MSLEFYPTYFEYFFDESKQYQMDNELCLFKETPASSSSPRASSQTAFESEEILSHDLEESEFSQSNSSSSRTFAQCKYEDICSVINSKSTDLNSFVEEMLSSEPLDPNIKRK